jgi:flagellar biosynthetic protein FliQ|tara:strand:- start:18 stop:284 length:267 start_codon:yes stop_codon:yes gene_type:complete
VDFDTNVTILREALWQVILTAGPMLGIALTVGLVIGILQAATSINEMTLSFVPKLLIVIAAFGILSPQIFNSLTEFFNFIFQNISGLK